MIEFDIPLEIVSPNASEHWTDRYKRNKRIRRLITSYWLTRKESPQPPCEILIERKISGKLKLMDDDNFIAGCKFIRDCIADLLIPGLAPGQADSDKKLTWQYRQITAKEKGVHITIMENSEIEQAAQDLIESTHLSLDDVKNLSIEQMQKNLKETENKILDKFS